MKAAMLFLFLGSYMCSGRVEAQTLNDTLQLIEESATFYESALDQDTYIQLKGFELGEENEVLPQLELQRITAFTTDEQDISDQSSEEIFNNLYEQLSTNNLNDQLELLGTDYAFEDFSTEEDPVYFDDWEGSSQDVYENQPMEPSSSGLVSENPSVENTNGESINALLQETADGQDPSQFGTLLEVRDLNPLISWQKNMLINGRSVGLVVEKSQIHRISDTLFQLDVSGLLGNQFRLCPGELFIDQPVAGEGTTFVIGTKTLITASHVFAQPIENYAIVFGYELISKKGAYEVFIPVSRVYFPTRIILDASEEDITVFEVDRPLHVSPLPLSTRQRVPDKGLVYMIGHPMGLPKKVAMNATVGENGNASYFYTSLDAFQGNSGSPVFLFGTNEVIGILVSGQKDYEWNGQCNQSTSCSPPYCRGEKVMRIQQIFR